MTIRVLVPILGGVALLGAAGCVGEGDSPHTARGLSTNEPTEALAAPAYDDAYTWERDEGSAPLPGDETTIAADNQARAAEDAWRRSRAHWVNRLRARAQPNTAIVVVTCVGDGGPRVGGQFRAMEMRVEASLGDVELTGTLEVVQYAFEGEFPITSGHLRPELNRRYLIVVAPSPHVVGAHQLELDFDEPFYGWGTERPDGLFKIAGGPDAVATGDLAADLRNLGGMP